MSITTDTSASSAVLSPLYLLQHKKEAELSDGAFVRYQTVAPEDRSRFSPADGPLRVKLGLGYVQAVLAALHGVVRLFSYDAPGLTGRAALRSIGRSITYHFTWNDDHTANQFLLGGFTHSAGKPTYQAALLALVQAVALYRSGQTGQSAELVERWYSLVQTMERAYPRRFPEMGWEKPLVRSACTHSECRVAILRVCDALRMCLSFRLPDLARRETGVTAEELVPTSAGTTIIVPGTVLLNPAGIEATKPAPPEAAPSIVAPPEPLASTASPPSVSPIPAPRRTRTRKPKAEVAPRTAPDALPAELCLFGAHTARIQLALQRGGPVMLVGPTATGKTTQAIAAAQALGWGIEAVTLDEGWEADDLFGAYTRTRRDREWVFVPGPVTRWAERAIAGERVVLLLDELARGHKTVVSAVMRLLNEHHQSAIAGMKLPVPDGEDGPFHIVDIRATQQRLVIPCSRVRIVATANQGEQYAGLDLADPAFGRRWTGGWLQLAGYPADEAAKSLGARLGLAPTAALIRAMQQVELHVLAYQRKEEALRATLDLATLIAWGSATRFLLEHTKSTVKKAFRDAARDVWLDRLCPLEGAVLDPDIERVLLGFVTSAAPATLV
jgi:hypothetical protein